MDEREHWTEALEEEMKLPSILHRGDKGGDTDSSDKGAAPPGPEAEPQPTDEVAAKQLPATEDQQPRLPGRHAGESFTDTEVSGLPVVDRPDTLVQVRTPELHAEPDRDLARTDAPPASRDQKADARPPVAERPQIPVAPSAATTSPEATPMTDFPEPPVIGRPPRYVPFFAGALPKSRAVMFGQAVPDTVLDGADLPGLTVRSASLRGDRHRYTKEVRQDAMGIWQIDDGVTGALLVCAADGVSSQELSHLGAAEACRLLRDYAAPKVSRFFRAAGDLWVTDLWEDLAELIGREMTEYARRLHIDPKELSTTLAAALIEVNPANPEERRYVVLNVGDARAYVLHNGKFVPCLPEAHARSDAITSTATSALPTSVGHVMTGRGVIGSADMLMVCSDGMSDPMRNLPVCDTLAAWWGVERIPSVPEFGWQVGYRIVSYDDDRTAVCVWGRER